MILVAKLVAFGCVNNCHIGVCAMAGVNRGPFIDYKSRFIGGSAGELFDFAHTGSRVSKDYQTALEIAVRFGVRIVYIGSIDDQLVSLEVALSCHFYVCCQCWHWVTHSLVRNVWYHQPSLYFQSCVRWWKNSCSWLVSPYLMPEIDEICSSTLEPHTSCWVCSEATESRNLRSWSHPRTQLASCRQSLYRGGSFKNIWRRVCLSVSKFYSSALIITYDLIALVWRLNLLWRQRP